MKFTDMLNMTNVQFDINSFKNYLSGNNIKVSNDELTQLNCIFSQCDTISENGEQRADGKLTGDEVPVFQKMIAKLESLSNHVKNFIDSIATTEPLKTPEIKQVKSYRTNEELEIYNEKLNEAKNILLVNAKKLGLNEQEIAYIENITTESISKGPARYDENDDRVYFNLNDSRAPDVGNFVKIIMHEITHGMRKNDNHTKALEYACEQRGIEIARKLYDEGLIENFVIWGDENCYADIASLDSDEKTDKFLDYWVNACY